MQHKEKQLALANEIKEFSKLQIESLNEGNEITEYSRLIILNCAKLMQIQEGGKPILKSILEQISQILTP